MQASSSEPRNRCADAFQLQNQDYYKQSIGAFAHENVAVIMVVELPCRHVCFTFNCPYQHTGLKSRRSVSVQSLQSPYFMYLTSIDPYPRHCGPVSLGAPVPSGNTKVVQVNKSTNCRWFFAVS